MMNRNKSFPRTFGLPMLLLLVLAALFLPSSKAAGVGGTTVETLGDKIFVKKGDKFYVTNRDALDLHERLPSNGTFTVGRNPATGEYYLQLIDSFDVNKKIYGDTQPQANRILQTFWDRKGISTGVLLTGEKGSGKTFLAKLLSVQAAAPPYHCPTIVINQPHSGEQFNAFLQSIRQPVVVIFDEFEKVFSGGRHRYHDEERRGVEFSMPAQDSTLTLLDGTYTSQMLFVFTSNDKNKISTNMRNRPGRVYYVIDFHGLSVKFIREYCEDNLKDQSQLGSVIAVSSVFEAFNFDMLQALVEEMNRYGESADQALEFLNVQPDYQAGGSFQLELTFLDKNNTSDANEPLLFYEHHWSGNPLTRVIEIPYRYYQNNNQKDDDSSSSAADNYEDEPWDLSDHGFGRRGRNRNNKQQPASSILEVTAADHLVSVDAYEGKFIYFHPQEQAKVVLTKHRHHPRLAPSGTYLSYSKLAAAAGEEAAADDSVTDDINNVQDSSSKDDHDSRTEEDNNCFENINDSVVIVDADHEF